MEEFKIPRGTHHYWFIYDAKNDRAEPIPMSDAYKILQSQFKDLNYVEMSKDFELQDGVILVAFKFQDLEALLRSLKGQPI